MDIRISCEVLWVPGCVWEPALLELTIRKMSKSVTGSEQMGKIEWARSCEKR
jgi:hypothetical protein